jgi:hypothetical protein
LSEDITGERTVAPGCAGTLAGGRCTLSQFLEHIWKPQADIKDITRPTVNIPGTDGPADINKLNFDQLFGKINSYRTNTGFGITGNSEATRLIGAADYYEGLSKIGLPIEKAISNTPNPTKQQAKLFGLAKSAATAVQQLRWKDMETFRLGKNGMASDKYLGLVPETRTVSTGVKGQPDFKTLDSAATVSKYEKDHPDIRDNLKAAMAKFAVNDKAKDHFKAIGAASSARWSCGCALPMSAPL